MISAPIPEPPAWADEEEWTAYDWWKARHPDPPEPPKDRLQQSIDAARGGPAPVQMRRYA